MGKIHKSETFIFLLVAFSFLIGLAAYGQLPDTVASHWNTSGEVNGSMSRFWGTFFEPFVALALFLLFLFVPRMDPMRKNIEKFRPYYDNVILFVFFFLFYLYTLTLYENFGYNFDLLRFIAPAFGAMFFYFGVALPHTEPNWTLGIRTPWTISNEVVWKKTHKIGGTLFKISGVLALFGVLFPQWAIWWILAPLILSSLYLLSYSYFAFTKLRV